MLGEQVFDALGKRWTLFLGNAAQCAVEEQYDKGFFAVVADAVPDVDPETAFAIATAMSTGSAEGLSLPALEKMNSAMRRIRLSVLRDLAWHGLRKYHPSVTIAQISDITDDMGHEAFGEIIGKAIQAAQGKGDDDAVAPGKLPTRGRGRTGKSASATGRGSASKPPRSGSKAPRPRTPRSADG